jgi:hypothetical protein
MTIADSVRTWTPHQEGCCTTGVGISARPAVGCKLSAGVVPYSHHQWDRTRGRGAPSFSHPPASSALSTRNMSQTRLNASSSSSSSSNFQSVLNAALDAYESKTKTKLLTHPLTTRLQSCDSPTTILSILQDFIQQFDRRRRSDEKLTSWLNPTINVLYAFSSTVGQGLGLVSLN